MQTESRLSGYRRENNRNYTGLDVPDELWLEELGDMTEAAVAGLRRGQSSTAGCKSRLAAG